VNPLLTENALRAHCDGLNDVAACTDARIEEDGKLALFLCATYPRRCSDPLESAERANGTINLSATYAPPKEREVSISPTRVEGLPLPQARDVP
jgi:hypothetical protein